jgi:predicted MFS family arabinose efflux permease
MVRRWGNVKVVIWVSIVTAIFLLPLALVEHWLAAAIGFIGISATMYIRYTAFVVYMLDLVPKVQQSIMSGSGEMAAGFGFALMALGGGIVLTQTSFRDFFLLGAALSLIGTLTFWWHGRKSKPKRKLAPI